MSSRIARLLIVVLLVATGHTPIPVGAADGEPRTPGFVFIQLDGLAESTFREALQSGRMPFLAGLIEDGSHTLGSWRTTAATATTVAQAGLFHDGWRSVPGFRWWVRDAGHMIDFLDPGLARRFEQTIDGPTDLLIDDGASITSLFAGGAQRTTLVTTRLEGLAVVTAVVGFLADVDRSARLVGGLIDGLVAALERHGRGDAAPLVPDVKRKIPISVVGPALEWAFADVSVAAVIEELERGTSRIYASLTTYDEIGHYAGSSHPAALAALEKLDRALAQIDAAARRTERPYQLVVLSDHGQTDGEPFARRFGESLSNVVRRLSSGPGAGTELDPDDFVIAASGNLAHVYLDPHGQRLDAERIEESYPDLVAGLADHPGVGIVVLREAGGPVAIGPAGRLDLRSGSVHGQDPTAHYGELAARSLSNIVAPADAGDVVVISTYDPVADEVYSFEPQLGSHGGIGGRQMEPFLLYPSALEPGARPLHLVGLDALRAKTVEWLAAQPPDPHVGRAVCASAGVAGAEGRACAHRDRFGAMWTLSLQDTADDGLAVSAHVRLDVSDASDPRASSRNELGSGTTTSSEGSFRPRFGGAIGDLSITTCVDARSGPRRCRTASVPVPQLEGHATPAQRARLERLAFELSLEEFLAVRQQERRIGVDADFDWSSDGCSAGPFARFIDEHLQQACVRHDFGYRNLGQRFYDPTDSVRKRLDDRLVADLLALGWDDRARGVVHAIQRFIAPAFYGEELTTIWRVPPLIASRLKTPPFPDPPADLP